MRKLQSVFFLAGVFAGIFILAAAASSFAIERQPNSDYHARREALAKKAAGVVVLFAATENDGPNDLYGFRQDDNFYYLSGLSEPGAALLIPTAWRTERTMLERAGLTATAISAASAPIATESVSGRRWERVGGRGSYSR